MFKRLNVLKKAGITALLAGGLGVIISLAASDTISRFNMSNSLIYSIKADIYTLVLSPILEDLSALLSYSRACSR